MVELTSGQQIQRERLVKEVQSAEEAVLGGTDSYTFNEAMEAYARIYLAQKALKRFDKNHSYTTIRVEVKSEVGTSREPAKVLVYDDEHLVAEVFAEVELQQGADDGWYHCVTLKKK